MEWNIFDKWLDIRLYQQMKELIYVTCSKEDKYVLNKKNREGELFTGEVEKTIDEEYGLHYPGEILERLGEHREVTVKQMRALGLALAKTKNLQEDKMFIGNQLPAFLKKLNGLSDEKDPFLLGICYLMDEKTKRESYERFISYPFTGIGEMLFALSILPEDDGLWKKIQGKLNAKLGKEREFSVYENPRVYVWLAQNFQPRVKGYRKKDMDAFKYLMRLPFGNASGNNQTVRNKLLENGYAAEEIVFLNYIMIQNVYFPDCVRTTSITGEKMAVEVCRSFLNAEKEYPQQAYDLCSQLCAFYKSFGIKIGGYEGIADALGSKVEIKNVKAFQVLYPYSKGYLNKWKRIDLMDNRWDALYSWLPLEEYDECVTKTLETETDAVKMADGLKHYRELTGKDYTERFWEKSAFYYYQGVFIHLAEHGILPVVTFMEEFIKEYRQDAETAKEKWENFLELLHSYMDHIQSHEAYVMLGLFVEEFGINGMEEIFSVTNILENCFSSQGSYYNRSWKLDLFRPFLEVEEHRMLFSWIDDYIFQKHTEKYFAFLIHVLSQEDNLLWFPKEDAREIVLCLLENGENIALPDRIRELYLTESEQQELRNRENFLADRRALKRRMDAIKMIKKEFTKTVANSRLKAGQFKAIKKFVDRRDNYRQEAERMAVSYLRALMEKEGIRLYAAEDMGELFQVLSKLYCDDALELETVKKFVRKMEEVQNEEKDDETHTDGQ